MRVAFVAHSLRPGGSERQLITLATGLAEAGHDVIVIVFRGGGAFESELREADIDCYELDRRVSWYGPHGIRRMVQILRAWQPDVVHSYLSLPNLVVAGLRPVLGRAKLAWGVRAAEVVEGFDRLSRAALGATVALSRVPDVIIANSEAGYRYHVRRGYPERKMVVIENGIDTDRYAPDPVGRKRLRRELGVRDEERLVGLVARLDPVKDHATFLEAAALVAGEEPDVRFVCVGAAEGSLRAPFDLLARKRGITDRLHWLRDRSDMSAVYSALDIGCLSSISEGFPNVVAEAMACGTPCVVTDVGDAARIVEGTGVVVPPRRPPALAAGIRKLIPQVGMNDGLGEAVRATILEYYSAPRLVNRTVALFDRTMRS
jgi:glycosyltransferase involved in cell wall biosynthesis